MKEADSTSVIENKERNEDEQVALEVAEASRELDWKSKSFIASMFLGELDLGLCDPFPEQGAEVDVCVNWIRVVRIHWQLVDDGGWNERIEFIDEC